VRWRPAIAEAPLKRTMPVGRLRVEVRDGMVYIGGATAVRMPIVSPISHSIDRWATRPTAGRRRLTSRRCDSSRRVSTSIIASDDVSRIHHRKTRRLTSPLLSVVGCGDILATRVVHEFASLLHSCGKKAAGAFVEQAAGEQGNAGGQDERKRAAHLRERRLHRVCGGTGRNSGVPQFAVERSKIRASAVPSSPKHSCVRRR
jgi:hypothetical protein